jgi:hypothetical protein
VQRKSPVPVMFSPCEEGWNVDVMLTPTFFLLLRMSSSFRQGILHQLGSETNIPTLPYISCLTDLIHLFLGQDARPSANEPFPRNYQNRTRIPRFFRCAFAAAVAEYTGAVTCMFSSFPFLSYPFSSLSLSLSLCKWRCKRGG